MHIAFPYHINQHHRTAAADHHLYIRQLIEQLLLTSLGERVNRPDFGGGINQMLFSPNSNELIAANEFLLKGALQQWLGELILVESVTSKAEEEVLTTTVQYIVLESQERYSDQFESKLTS